MPCGIGATKLPIITVKNTLRCCGFYTTHFHRIVWKVFCKGVYIPQKKLTWKKICVTAVWSLEKQRIMYFMSGVMMEHCWWTILCQKTASIFYVHLWYKETSCGKCGKAAVNHLHRHRAAALTGQQLPRKNILIQPGMNDTRNMCICSFIARAKISAAVILMWGPDESDWLLGNWIKERLFKCRTHCAASLSLSLSHTHTQTRT